jgi:hypothetical protein
VNISVHAVFFNPPEGRFVLECLEGETFIEVPSGRGRTDILILYKKQKYIIESI